jgi:hypothetical protein
VAIGLEQQLQGVPIVLIVIDDKDTGKFRCHAHLKLFSVGSSLWRSATVI